MPTTPAKPMPPKPMPPKPNTEHPLIRVHRLITTGKREPEPEPQPSPAADKGGVLVTAIAESLTQIAQSHTPPPAPPRRRSLAELLSTAAHTAKQLHRPT